MLFSNVFILAGLPGSGKSLAAEVFRDLGWCVVSAGNTIREMCAREGLSGDRATLQEYGANLLESKGDKYFADVLMSQAELGRNVVFEGIRPIEVINILRSEISGKVLYVEAHSHIRFERLKKRDGIDVNAFRFLDVNEMERQVTKVKKIADIFLRNDGSKEEFVKKVVDLSQYGQESGNRD